MPETYLNFVSSESSSGTDAVLSYNLNPPVRVPQDAQNVTVSVLSASFWYSTPNVWNKVARIGFIFNSQIFPAAQYVDREVAIPTGLYDPVSLSATYTRLVFKNFTFTAQEYQYLIAGGDNPLLFQAIIRHFSVSIEAQEGTSKLQLVLRWNEGTFDHAAFDVDYSNQADSRLRTYLDLMSVIFPLGTDSVLQDLCGFTEPTTFVLNDQKIYRDSIVGGVLAKKEASFDRIQYYLLACSLADQGILMNGIVSRGILARIHIPSGTEPYAQILYEPSNPAEFAASALMHNYTGVSSISLSLLDQYGIPVSTMGYVWSALLRISWT